MEYLVRVVEFKEVREIVINADDFAVYGNFVYFFVTKTAKDGEFLISNVAAFPADDILSITTVVVAP